jgi:hypothetical protein
MVMWEGVVHASVVNFHRAYLQPQRPRIMYMYLQRVLSRENSLWWSGTAARVVHGVIRSFSNRGLEHQVRLSSFVVGDQN